MKKRMSSAKKNPAMMKWLGPYVRLEGISINQLPPDSKGSADASIESPNDGSPTNNDVSTFISAVLTEAIPFIDGVAPKTGDATLWKQKGAPKRYPSSEAPVDIYEYAVPGKELDKISGMNQFAADRKDEVWFCRRSCHRDASEKGTASWEEFVHTFKEHHHESEDAYTATVIGAREAITWDTTEVEVEVHGEQWGNITLSVIEMKHKIDPKPLRNRTFPVLQLSASLADTREFVIISIPITDFAKSPHSVFAREKSLVVGAYAAIERIRMIPSSGEIEWIMATASNAGGVLPQWLQNMAVAGMVAQDVHMFLVWIPSQRKSKTAPPAEPSRQATFDKSLPVPPVASAGESVISVPPAPISKEPAPISKDPVLFNTGGKPPLSRRESMNKRLPAAPVH
jgi:hypothetical protein